MNRVYEQTLYYEKGIDNENIDCFVLNFKIYFSIYDDISTVFLNDLLELETSPKTCLQENTTLLSTIQMTIDFFDLELQNNKTVYIGSYNEPLKFIRMINTPFSDDLVPKTVLTTQAI